MRPSRDAPDVVAGLDRRQCHALDQAVAAEQLEGWHPTRDDLLLLAAECRGDEVLDGVRTAVRGDGKIRESRWAAMRPGRAPYLIPGSTILRNELGLHDAAALHRAESILTAIRLVRCHTDRADPLVEDGIHRLIALHGYVFQDVYSWAGQVRTVDLSKNGHSFTRASAVWDVLISIHDALLAAPWESADLGESAYLLARTYAELNQAHPFREGNGRTGTMLLHLLVRQTAFDLDLTGVDRADWIQASRDSAPFRQAGAPSPRPFIPIFRRALVPREG